MGAVPLGRTGQALEMHDTPFIRPITRNSRARVSNPLRVYYPLKAMSLCGVRAVLLGEAPEGSSGGCRCPQGCPPRGWHTGLGPAGTALAYRPRAAPAPAPSQTAETYSDPAPSASARNHVNILLLQIFTAFQLLLVCKEQLFYINVPLTCY